MNFENPFESGTWPQDEATSFFPEELNEPEKPKEWDMSDPSTMILSSDWIDGDPASRAEMKETAFGLILDELTNNVGKKVQMEVFREGERVREEVSLHGPDGKLNRLGKEYLEKSRQMLEMAAADPDGGVLVDAFSNEVGVKGALLEFMDQRLEKGEDSLPDFDKWFREKTAFDSEDYKAGLQFEDYASFANQEGVRVDPENPTIKSEFSRALKRSTYDPATMMGDKVVDSVEGMPVINPNHFSEIDRVEAGINGLEGFSPSAKKMMVMDYHQSIEERIVDLARQFSAADSGPIDSIYSRPLMDELAAHIEKGGSGVDFLRENKERFDPDSYGPGSEIAATFRDAVVAMGTGATWLVGAGVGKVLGAEGLGEAASRPAQIWGELAEESAGAYRNPIAFSVGSIDINRRDLTELIGQLGSFVAVGGVTSLATKAMGLTAAKEATKAAAKVAAAEGTVKVGTAAAEVAAKKTLGEKTYQFIKTAVTDPTAYLGGVQASGMSFGKTYNAVMARTGDAKQAYYDASVQGVSDGLAALLATGVMNQVAPGAERLLGGSGKIEGSLVQSVRAVTAGRKGMTEFKKALDEFNLKPEVTKQLVKDMGKEMRKAAVSAGLRSSGALKEVAAEGIEEMTDEALSDVIAIMIDDSKSWSEGDWGNIHDNFREYVKAGILGAMGGGVGSSFSSVPSTFKVFGKDEKRRAAIREQVTGQWDLIKAKVNEFQRHPELVSNLGAGPVKMAEVLADDTGRYSTKQKSDMLIEAVKGKLARDFNEASVDIPEVSEPEKPASAPQATPAATPAATTPASTPSTSDKEKTIGGKMADMGYSPPAGQKWKDVQFEDSKPVKLSTNTQLFPVSIDGDSHAGARVVTTKNGKTTERFISPDEAIALLKGKGKPAQTAIGFFEEGKERNAPDKRLDNSTRASDWASLDGKNEPEEKSAPVTLDETDPAAAENAKTKLSPRIEALKAAAILFGHKIVDTGIPTGFKDHWGKTQNFGTQLIDRLFSGSTVGRWMDNLRDNASPEAVERFKQLTTEGFDPSSKILSPMHRVWFGHDPLASIGDIIGKFGVKALPEWVLQLGKDFMSKSGVPLPGVQWLVHSGLVSDRKATDWLSLNVGEALGAGVGILGTYKLKKRAKAGEKVSTPTALLGVAFKLTGGVLSSNPILIITGVADAVIMVKADPEGIAEAMKKMEELSKDAETDLEEKKKDEQPKGKQDDKSTGTASVDAEVPTQKQESDGDSKATGTGSDTEADSDGRTEPGGSQPIVSEVEATVESEEKEEAETEGEFVPEVTDVDDLYVRSTDLAAEEGVGFVLHEGKPPTEFVGNTKEKQNKTIWNEDGEIRVSREFLESVLADDTIEDKAQHVADAVAAFVGNKLQALVPSNEDASLIPKESYLVDQDELSGKKQGASGGTWATDGSGNWLFRPAKGKTLKFQLGDILQIGGDPSKVLIFVDVASGGQLVFKKVDTTKELSLVFDDPSNDELTKNINREWSKSRLTQIAKKFTSELLTNLLVGNPSKKDLAAFKSIIEKLVEQVAPGAKPVYVKNGDHFMQVAHRPKDGMVMEVDVEKTAAVLKALLGKADPSHSRYTKVLGLEASRLLSKWIDEEQIHILTSKIFSIPELVGFLNDALKPGWNEFVRKMAIQTIKERFPNVDPEATSGPNSLKAQPRGKYIVASELIRKLHQIATGGSFSEEGNLNARYLVAAMNGDVKEGGILHTIGELLRRYTNQIRQLLNFRRLQGRLPDSLSPMLARLNKAYLDANLDGDVDMIASKAKAATHSRLHFYTSSNEEETNRILRNGHSNAMIQLRDLGRDFESIGVSDIITTDDKLQLVLDENARAHAERHSDRFDLKAIEAALEALNESESYQRQWMEVSMAYDNMLLAEANLAFDPSKLFDRFGSLDFDPQGVMAQIIAGMRPNDPRNNRILEGLRSKRQEIDDRIAFVEDEIQRAELSDLAKLEWESKQDKIRMFRLASKLGLNIKSEDFAEGARFENPDDFKKRLLSSYHLMMEHSPDFFSLDQSSQADLMQKRAALLDERKTNILAVKIFTGLAGDKKRFIGDFESTVTTEADRVVLRLLESASKVDETVAKERYNAFLVWQEASDLFNQRVTRLKDRAIGNFFNYQSKEYGRDFMDVRAGKTELVTRGPQVVDPEDFLGYELLEPGIEAQGVAANVGRPRNPTDEELKNPIESEIVRIRKRRVHSNAAFRGREALKEYFIDSMRLDLPVGFNHDSYAASGGFSFESFEDNDRTVYESADQAFPSFSGLDEMFEFGRKVEEDGDLDTVKLTKFVDYIAKAEDWLNHVRFRLNEDLMVMDMNGKQSPAAMATPALKKVLGDLEALLKDNKGAFTASIGKFLIQDDSKPFGESFERNSNGTLKVRMDADGRQNLGEVYANLKKAFGSNRSGIYFHLIQAQLSADTVVDLTRKMMREFTNDRWIRNVERTATTTIRDLAYTPDDPAFLSLRETIIDIPTLRNLGFSLGYLAENESPYWVSSLYGFELLESLENLTFGDEEFKVSYKPKRKGSKYNETGDVVLSEGYDKNDVRILAAAGSENPTFQEGALVQPFSELDEENRMTNQAVGIDDFDQELMTDASSRRDQALRKMDRRNQSVRKALTTALLFIGYRVNSDQGSIQDSKDFLQAVQRKAINGTGSVPEMVETAMKGMFRLKTSTDTTQFELLTTEFYEAFPEWGKMEGELERKGFKRDFDPLKFAMDLLSFKASFERKAVEAARIKDNDIISQLFGVIKENKEEQEKTILENREKNKDSDKSLPEMDDEDFLRVLGLEVMRGQVVLKNGTVKSGGGLAVYDSRLMLMEDGDLSSNPVLSLLLYNQPGRTIVVRPTSPQSWKAGSKAGLRLIPGKDGKPNVLWAPFDHSGRAAEEAAMQTALKNIASDPNASELIVSLAKNVRDTLAPAFDPDRIIRTIESKLGAELEGLSEEGMVLFDQKLEEYYLALSKLVQDAGMTKAELGFTEKFGMLYGKRADRKDPAGRINSRKVASQRIEENKSELASDIILLSRVMLDPEYKRALDRAYVGIDVDQSFGLPESAENALRMALKQLNNATADNLSWTVDEASDGDPDGLASIPGGTTPTGGFKPENLEPNTAPLITAIAPGRLEAKTEEEKVDGVIPPVDSMLFNGFGRIVARIKLLNQQLAPVVDDSPKSAKGLLATNRASATGDKLAFPIFDEKNKPDPRSPARAYMIGEAINLNRPTGPGNKGSLITQAMNYNRYRTESAAFLNRIPDIGEQVSRAAGMAVSKGLSKNKESSSFAPVKVEVPLSDSLYETLKKSLPQLENEERIAREAFEQVDKDIAFYEKRFDELTKVLDRPLGFTNKEFSFLNVRGSLLIDQMASKVVRMAQKAGNELDSISGRETALFTEELRSFLETKMGTVFPAIQRRLFNLHELVRKRDQLKLELNIREVVSTDLDIAEELGRLNIAIAAIDSAAVGFMNQRLKDLGFPPRKAQERSIWADPEGRFDGKWFKQVETHEKPLESEDVEAIRRHLRLDPDRVSDSIVSKVLPRLSEEFISSFTDGKRHGFRNDKNKEARDRLFEFLDLARGRDQQQIFDLIDQAIVRLEGDESHGFAGALRMLALTTSEGQALLEAGAYSEKQKQARVQAQSELIQTEAKLIQLQRAKNAIKDVDGQAYVGRFRFNDQRKNSKGKRYGVNIELGFVHPKLASFSGIQDQRAKEAEWAQSDTLKKEWLIRQRALDKALYAMTQDGTDFIYKKLRGQVNNLGVFDPAYMVNEAVMRVETQKAIIANRFAEAVSDAEKAGHRGLSVEALNLYATGQRPFLFRRQGDRVERHQMSWNQDARRKMIGVLLDDANGEPIIMMHQDHKERLAEAFPEKFNPTKSNQAIKGLVLRALSPDQSHGGFLEPTPGNIPWSGDFSLTNGQPMTTVEAGKKFSAKFRSKIVGFVGQTRAGGLEEKDLGENAMKSLGMFSSLIEKLVHAYDHPNLANEQVLENQTPLKEQIRKLLQSIDDDGLQGNFAFNDATMMGFDLIGLYSRVFAEVESQFIMESLVAGLSIHEEKTSLNLMKLFHHQDSRMRMRFSKTHQAREVAMHLQAMLESGFDGATGREGHQVAHKAAQDRLAKASKEVGSNALDHTISYLVAQLDGLSDASGMNLTEALSAWYNDMKKGIVDLRKLDVAQRTRWGKMKRYFNANHVELIRDIPLVEEVVKILKESNAMDNFGYVSGQGKDARDESSKKTIAALRAALLEKATTKAKETSKHGDFSNVEHYAREIRSTLKDAYDATEIVKAVMSKPEVALTERVSDDAWTNNGRDARKPTYSSVPLRLAYAANPNSIKPNVPREGRWIPDPADTVSIDDSAFFGGYGRHEINKKDTSVLRPISMNGLTAPFSILEDSLYRTNVAPNYEVLRGLLGRVQTPKGVPVVDKALLISEKLRNNRGFWREHGASYQTAVAAVAGEIENNIENDSQIGVVQTGFSQLATFLSSVFVVRALSSVQQLWNQTLPPAIFVVVKKMATGQWREAAEFLSILSDTISSLASDPRNMFADHEGRLEFHHKLAQFTKNVSPYVHFRGVDGQDRAVNELRGQTRYGVSPAKAIGGRFVKAYQNIGEEALNYTIGFGERHIARAIFAAELLSELRRHSPEKYSNLTVKELIEMKADEIPVVANQMARVKVSDMMGQSDISKKSWFFQNRSESPSLSALWKSLVRFSNHTATTSANLVAFVPNLNSEDQRTRQEARENVIGTLGQNIAFHFLKFHTMVPLLAYVFFSLNDDDDEEDSIRKAQKFADDWLSSEGDGVAVGFGKEIVFGGKRQLFLDSKSRDAAMGSAIAELGSKVGMEFVQGLPMGGVLVGYSPISAAIKPIMNNASEETAAMLTGTRVAEAWYDRNSVGVREHSPGVFESIANTTAPTAVIHDGLSAAAMTIDGFASDDVKTWDAASYALSEFIPFLRDYRSARKQVLREQIEDK